VGTGDPRHTPAEILALLPTRFEPVSAGSVVTDGISVTAALDADHEV
jgi:hypothetical protein